MSRLLSGQQGMLFVAHTFFCLCYINKDQRLHLYNARKGMWREGDWQNTAGQPAPAGAEIRACTNTIKAWAEKLLQSLIGFLQPHFEAQ
jgi:hypothetical protein